jgi:hypothetical protein
MKDNEKCSLKHIELSGKRKKKKQKKSCNFLTKADVLAIRIHKLEFEQARRFSVQFKPQTFRPDRMLLEEM